MWKLPQPSLLMFYFDLVFHHLPGLNPQDSSRQIYFCFVTEHLTDQSVFFPITDGKHARVTVMQLVWLPML